MTIPIRPTIATLQELGTSLADVAAFMQEVELDLGMNPTSKEGRRGIDRLRLLAFRMQSIQSEPVNDPDYKDDGERSYIYWMTSIISLFRSVQ